MGFSQSAIGYTTGTTQEASIPTIINVYKASNGNVQNVYVIPANKRFILMGCCVYGSAYLEIYKTDGTTKILKCSNSVQINQSYIWEYAQTESVNAKAENGAEYYIWGFLIDV